ncbi:hypothetical protein K438DRAFT_704906 [Mycena galopus ATCC 62051]|nr:hypothetical protein K438DRAFT_704906 [Mycena galopus ATCC 62051]
MPTWVANRTIDRDDLFPLSSLSRSRGTRPTLGDARHLRYRGHHCQEGTSTSMNRELFDWLDEVFASSLIHLSTDEYAISYLSK